MSFFSALFGISPKKIPDQVVLIDGCEVATGEKVMKFACDETSYHLGSSQTVMITPPRRISNNSVVNYQITCVHCKAILPFSDDFRHGMNRAEFTCYCKNKFYLKHFGTGKFLLLDVDGTHKKKRERIEVLQITIKE